MSITENVDWRSIRPLKGGRDKGFEELCSQLARAEVSEHAQFIRKGNPDAGVECYAIYENGSECAWQAKYLFSLGNSQWRQIDESVRTALQKHPQLTRYVVCLPMDLPDARVPGKESAFARWNTHIEKWAGWATARGMAVEFAFWGSSELLDRLTKPEHAGRVKFWFNSNSFDKDWFMRRLEETRETAGPRYTPEVHVNLPIAERFEAFGRTSHFFHRAISMIRDLADAWRLAYSFGPSRRGKEGDPEVEAGIRAVISDAVVNADMASISEAIDEIVVLGSAMEVQPGEPLPFDDVAEKVAVVKGTVDRVVRHLLTRQAEYQVISQYRYQFENFAEKLRRVHEELLEAQQWGGAAVMIVQGEAGTGKTHLLCDIAHRRLADGHPTVLLMGQSFTSDRAPWPQVADLLDASDSSADDFVGGLECAAQAIGVRALVMIDALNEGKGLSLWPTHLSGFLAHFARSDWIGVVLSIRSSYEKLIPEAVREDSVIAIHQGFGERSYDAMRTFFKHYGLEVPSAPLIAPEFGNPLFLKTLCSGLKDQGATQFRQGINGITRIFDLYISSINERIASKLSLPPWNKAAETALRALVDSFPAVSERWLTVEAAEYLLNGILPGRLYEESLYRMLVVEGVLVQDASHTARQGKSQEIVFIAYDRLADYLVTEALLDAHFDPANAVAEFETGGSLGVVVEGGYKTQGLLEALCVQLPERTGREVADLVPCLAQLEGFEGAFSQSLVWRDVKSFSQRTCDLVRTRLEPERQEIYSILGALLTLATTQGHPLNAKFLDSRLRKEEMPARDAWWSIYLHHSVSGSGPARRLLDWALMVSPTTRLDDDLVDLCAITLAWMLTTPNRSARDSTTKALVNLLTDRFEATTRLINDFADVDDMYVVERVYAVAYGVATRSNDPDEVKAMAECVYSRAFDIEEPPANILLRDYARGVIERALYLGSQICVDTTRIRPPFDSAPPVFPSEADVAPLLPSPQHKPHRQESKDWARSNIGYSVLKGELHRAIWENWGCSGEWLLLGLDRPIWQEPRIPENETTHTYWPVFNRNKIERYVLQRVFVLGWTMERFGEFDGNLGLDGVGRFPIKENIGHKYQWIAYREILALISDHFQYREYLADVERSHCYLGPWQNCLRDIDPTLTATLPSERSWNYRLGDSRGWWTAAYDGWEDTDRLEEWALRHDDLPRIEDLLVMRNPEDGTRWLNGNSNIRLTQMPPVGRGLFEVEGGEIMGWITAYLTHTEDTRTFVEWFNAKPFEREGITNITEVFNVFVGEHGWAPAADYKQVPFDDKRAGEISPVHLEAVAVTYSFREGPRDQLAFYNPRLMLPIQKIVQIGELHWSGRAADFIDSNDNVVAFDPSAYTSGPSTLLMQDKFFSELLKQHDLGIVWTVTCIKTLRLSGWAQGGAYLRISGAYWLSDTGPIGTMRPEVMERKRLP